jgi:hypothetical protein
MARPAIIPDVRRKRGNPYWGHALPLPPAVPTEFELQVRQLHLTQERYIYSAELKAWCRENRNRFYIPEWLLKVWNISVDLNFYDAA